MGLLKIGLFGGTFDPVHHGHLISARDAMEKHGLEKVFFIPCARSPHRRNSPVASGEIRLRLLQLAVTNEPGFEVMDWEIQRGGISYTIDTVRYVRAQMPEAKLYWLLGEDQAQGLESWRNIQELRKLVTFVFMPRLGSGDGRMKGRILDISATEIRKRLAQNQSVRYLLPESVLDEIQRLGVYRSR